MNRIRWALVLVGAGADSESTRLPGRLARLMFAVYGLRLEAYYMHDLAVSRSIDRVSDANAPSLYLHG